MKRKPIETSLGVLYGRDALYLDDATLTDKNGRLILRGAITQFAKNTEETGFINYTLTFNGVLASKMIELDSTDYEWESSFEEILDSDWIRGLGGKVRASHRHIFLQTYDYVFDVVCESFELVIENERTRN
jgi:hypothetical protein